MTLILVTVTVLCVGMYASFSRLSQVLQLEPVGQIAVYILSVGEAISYRCEPCSSLLKREFESVNSGSFRWSVVYQLSSTYIVVCPKEGEMSSLGHSEIYVFIERTSNNRSINVS